MSRTLPAFRPTVRRQIGLAAFAGAAIGLGGSVLAQATPAAGKTAEAAPSGRPAAESRIERYAKALRLDAAQTEAAKALYDAHQKALADNSKTFRDQLRDAQEDMSVGDRSGFEGKVQTLMQRQGEATKAMTDQFLSDLKALLRPDQEANWARFERLRRREQVLGGLVRVGGPGGGVGGANVDLTTLVKRLGVPAAARAGVDEALEAYEVDIDRPLQERERNFEEDRRQMGAVQRFTPESFQRKLDRDRAVDLKVREVNDRYARQIAALLPEELGRKLEEEYRQRSYRSIYRPTAAGKSLAAAQKLGSLTPQQREGLKSLVDQYRRDAKAAADRLAAATRKAEDEGRNAGGGMMVFGPGGMNANEKVDPAVAQARADRRDVDSKAKDALDKLLTPEQLADVRDSAGKGSGGAVGQKVEVYGDGAGQDMVFVSDIDLDEEEFADRVGGAPVVIMRTVGGVVGGRGGGGNNDKTVEVKGEPAKKE